MSYVDLTTLSPRAQLATLLLELSEQISLSRTDHDRLDEWMHLAQGDLDRILLLIDHLMQTLPPRKGTKSLVARLHSPLTRRLRA